MILLRYLYVVALVLWVGGLIVAGALVAPSVFGEVLLRLTWLSYAMGGIMFITLTLHRLLGARPVKYGIRVGIMSVMLTMMMVTGFYLIPGVNAIQADVKGPVAELPDADPRRLEFNRLHGLSNVFFAITAIGGLALCWWEARE